MELLPKNIRCLTFWKRSPESVEAIDKLVFSPIGDAFQLQIEQNDTRFRTLDSNEVLALLSDLVNKYHIQEMPEEYKAFRYEDNQEDFNLKFFLEIDLNDFTYLAIKGIHPFKQPHYQEIIALFNPFFH